MLIGHVRVPKADGSQGLELQSDAPLAADVERAHLYEDHASGSKGDRPGLDACLKAVRKGDTLVLWKLDRLGRSLRLFGGTVLPADDLHRILGEGPEMIDSTVIAEYVEQTRAAALAQGQLLGLQEGRLAGLREGILTVLEARFGPVPAALASQLGQLTDVAAATAQHRRAAVIASLDEFAQELATTRLETA